MVVLGRAQAALFKDVLEGISDLFSDATFNFSGRGFELQAMDTGCVAVVSFLLRPKAFIHYEYDCDSDLSMDLNLAYMAEFFRCANDDFIFSIKAEDHIIKFTLESPEDGVIEYDLVGVEAVLFEIPELSETMYTARVRMPSELFMLICEKLNISPDSRDSETGVFITVRKDRVSFLVEGKTLYSTSHMYTDTKTVDNPKKAIIIEMEEEVFSKTFALRYMNSVSKVSILSDQVTISLSTELPEVFEYKIAEKGYFRYYMYPMTMR